MAQNAEVMKRSISHGHTDTHVAVVFSEPVKHCFFTIEEAENFCTAMADSIAKLRAHQAKKGN